VPPLTLKRLRQHHDRIPDFQSQAVPVCDQLAGSEILGAWSNLSEAVRFLVPKI
jgi:hypothetical protein